MTTPARGGSLGASRLDLKPASDNSKTVWLRNACRRSRRRDGRLKWCGLDCGRVRTSLYSSGNVAAPRQQHHSSGVDRDSPVEPNYRPSLYPSASQRRAGTRAILQTSNHHRRHHHHARGQGCSEEYTAQ